MSATKIAVAEGVKYEQLYHRLRQLPENCDVTEIVKDLKKVKTRKQQVKSGRAYRHWIKNNDDAILLEWRDKHRNDNQ